MQINHTLHVTYQGTAGGLTRFFRLYDQTATEWKQKIVDEAERRERRERHSRYVLTKAPRRRQPQPKD